jgi:2-methylisocitrate lyase-like PEP mutase family enzyme
LKRIAFRRALEAEAPLVMPLAHDALSARLIQRAGFRAFTVGGSALLAARHALPDIGLIGLTDMVEGLRDLAEASDLPFLADADDGYGDVKAVARLVEAYERIGVGGFLIEDQDRDRKQQRADHGGSVVERAVVEAKLKTALSVRSDQETFVIGRTDAYGALGLDEALRRAERFLALGCDGVFVAGLRRPEDFERVGRTLKGAMLSAAMFESGGTPWFAPAELGAMGFRMISYPASLIFRVTRVMADALSALRATSLGEAPFQPMASPDDARTILDEAVALRRWRDLEAAARASETGDDA